MALQPASITFQAFFGPTPPSISIHGSTPLALHIAFKSLIFWTWDSMKLWPPKPGFTDIMRTRSTSSSTYSMAERGVPGFRTTPAAQPNCLIWQMVRCKWVVEAASQWIAMMSAPALAKSSTRFSGFSIMRWQSSTASGSFLRRAATTSGPIVMFGTNLPSMTSTCTQSAPAFRTLPTSSPSLEKSADKIEGEILMDFASVLSFSTRGLVVRSATARGAGALAVRRLRRRAPAAATPAPTKAATAQAAPGAATETGSGW
mmetsp:Transcript_28539/g.76247  ORF Transcript_28539/g.76247 Transcript_28539/m.76247 type:complete len:259 (-) Transcript_28539:185-961(-)